MPWYRGAEEEGVDEIYLAELGAVDRLHRFDVAAGRWELADEATVARRLQDHRVRRGGRVTLVIGAIATTTGALLGGLGDARARQLLDEAPQHQSPEEYSNAERRYRTARSQAILGWTLLGAGGATSVTGIVLTSRGSGGQGEAAGGALGIRLQLWPTGLALRGSFR